MEIFLRTAFALGILMGSCHKPASTAEEKLIVGLKNCVQTAAGGKPVRLCLDSVLQDSRCPLNANCIWQGMAVVKFSVILNNGSHSVILSTNKNALGYAADTTIQNYKISFLNLIPYPGGSSPADTYAEMLIQRL